MTDNTDERLETLETKVAFQDDLIQKLNDVIAAQETRLHALEGAQKLIIERLRGQSGASNADAEEPPPHY